MLRLDSKNRVYTVCAEMPDRDSKNQLHIASAPMPLLDNNSPWDTASGVSNFPDSSILSDIRFDLQMFRSDNNSPPDNSRPSSIPEYYVLLISHIRWRRTSVYGICSCIEDSCYISSFTHSAIRIHTAISICSADGSN